MEDKVKILSWNIAGLRSKKEDNNWLNFLKQYDIVALQETWDKDCNFWIDGFTSHFVPAQSSAAGRDKGGLLILVSVHIRGRVKRVECTSANFLILEISLMDGTKLILVNCYNSQQEDHPNEHLNWLSEFLISYKESQTTFCYFIVMGDFNVHLCNMNCQIVDIDGPELTCPQHFEHTSKGEALEKLLSCNDLFEAGFPDEMTRTPTYVARGCKSIIDYIFLSSVLLKYVFSYNAIPSPFSDHNPVVMELTNELYFLNKNDPPRAVVEVKAKDQGRKLKWSKVIPVDFFQNIITKVAPELNTCTNPSVLGVEVIVSFETICSQVAKELTITSKKGKSRAAQGWFDQKCSKAYKL